MVQLENGRELEVSRFAFQCTVGYQEKDTDDGARFEVKFLFDEEEVNGLTDVVLNATDLTALLHEESLIGNLGKMVKITSAPVLFD